jgi:CheY-like chemotaxis protein
MLTELGFNDIISLRSGTECIDKLHLNPGLIFLDYQMEDMNGLEALEIIKDYFPGIGVVFCTAHEDLHVAVSAIKKGSFDYLLKMNATKKELTNVLNSLSMAQTETAKIY